MPHDHHKCAHNCDDQIPVIANVGRGIEGDTAHLQIAEGDNCSETHLEGWNIDAATGEIHSYWMSENINGGELSYQYNLRPFTDPRTFTITFIYRRPGRCEWSWTTPAMPYIWTLDPAGNLDDDPDHIVGSGVATLFIRTMHSDWTERLHYPPGTNRNDFNAPLPEQGWSATIIFGKGGDVEVPDFDDIAKIIGVSKQDIYNILEDKSVTINGIDASNIIDYINKCDKRDLDHIHADLGFNTTGHSSTGAFGGKNTVKEYIDQLRTDINNKFDNLNSDFDLANTIQAYSTSIGEFHNNYAFSDINWFNTFNGKDCGTASVTYAYSAEMRMCHVRIDYKTADIVPAPFGIGVPNNLIIGTIPQEIAPAKEIRAQMDIPGDGNQTLWCGIMPNGNVTLRSTFSKSAGATFCSLRNSIASIPGVDTSNLISEDEIWARTNSAQGWDCTIILTYFYSMRGADDDDYTA